MKRGGVLRKNNKELFLTLGILIIFAAGFFVYASVTAPEKLRFSIGNEISGNAVLEPLSSKNLKINENTEITPKILVSLLESINAEKLHKNLFTRKNAIINIEISEEKFYAEIDGEINVLEGVHNEPDIAIKTTKQELVAVLSSSNSMNAFKDSLSAGRISLDIFASKVNLFLKGYLNFYNSLKTKA